MNCGMNCKNELRLEANYKKSTMVKLFCAVVGVGSVFSVNIKLSETVDDLKKKIKAEKPGMIYFDADLLKLYLARNSDSWLNSRDEDIKALKKGEIPDRITSFMREELLMNETRNLSNDAYFSKTFERAEDDIHVLVELPEDASLTGLLHNKSELTWLHA
nr:crinkler 20 [Plasmopara viticola]